MKTLATLLSLTLVMTACSKHASHDHDHDHEHEHAEAHGHEGHEGHVHDAKLSLVSYGDAYEFYAEADPFVKDHHSHISLHLTRLSDFKPASKAEGELRLTIGGKIYKGSGKIGEHPGIIRIEIEPESAGKGQLSFVGTIDGDPVTQSFGTVEVYADEHTAHHEADEQTPHSPTGVPFPKQLSWRVNFSTEEVSLQPFGEIVRTMGVVEPARSESRQVVARSRGVVTFVGSLADGQNVAAGQSLFYIDASQMADNDLQVRDAEAQAALRQAKKELDRVEALAKEKLATGSELEQARKEYEVALANSKNTNRFGGGVVSVAAPIAGYITGLDVSNGQYVEAGQTLATISRTNNIQINIRLTPEQARRLSSVADVTVKGVSDPDAWSLSQLGGKVVGRGTAADPQTGMVPMTISMTNTPGYVGGQYVETMVRGGDGAEVLSVPRTALIDEEGHFSVFVQLSPEYFEKREVRTGRSDGMRTEILSGLEPGERVVGKGAVMVKISQSSGKLDPHAGHVH